MSYTFYGSFENVSKLYLDFKVKNWMKKGLKVWFFEKVNKYNNIPVGVKNGSKRVEM